MSLYLHSSLIIVHRVHVLRLSKRQARRVRLSLQRRALFSVAHRAHRRAFQRARGDATPLEERARVIHSHRVVVVIVITVRVPRARVDHHLTMMSRRRRSSVARRSLVARPERARETIAGDDEDEDARGRDRERDRERDGDREMRTRTSLARTDPRRDRPTDRPTDRRAHARARVLARHVITRRSVGLHYVISCRRMLDDARVVVIHDSWSIMYVVYVLIVRVVCTYI